MNNDIKVKVPETATKIAKETTEQAKLSQEDAAMITKTVADAAAKVLTSYDENVNKANAEFAKRLAKRETNIDAEIVNIKGQSDARYQELNARISQVLADMMTELELRGLSPSKDWATNLKKGFVKIGSQRVPLAGLVLSMLVTKDSTYVLRDQPSTETTWSQFIYGSGEKYFTLPAKPEKLLPKNTADYFFDDLLSVTVYNADNSIKKSVLFFEGDGQTSAALSALAPDLTFTLPTANKDVKSSVRVTIDSALIGYVVVERLKTYHIASAFDIKRSLIYIISIALSTYSAPVGLATAMFGESLWNQVMSDVKADPAFLKMLG